MISLSSCRSIRAAFVLGLCLVSTLPAAPQPPAVTADDFAKAPALIDPEAGAEILLKEITIDESRLGDFTWSYFTRVRIVDERGVGRFRKIELPFDNSNSSLSGISVRTYKPDGSVLNLDKKDIFERDVVRTRTTRRSVKSFAPPGLEPGVIFEYSYVEHRDEITPLYPLRFQWDVPARLVRYRLKPAPVTGYGLRSVSFHLPQFSLKADRDGFFNFEAVNLKGWKDEPYQFPPIQLQAAAVIYYNPQEGNVPPDRYWARASEKLHRRAESVAKVTKAVQTAADGMVDPGDSPEAKLRKIYDAVRNQLVNQDLDISGFSGAQRRKFAKNDNAEETLANKRGTGDDLIIAFTALARAAGLDARLAQANDRSFILYSENMREPFIFRKLISAVRLGEKWMFFDPGALYLPFGVIDWKYTGTNILVGDRQQGLLPMVPMPPAPASIRERKAAFKLDEQGTLEGRVTVTGTGYLDAAAKNRYDALSATEREQRLKEEVQKQFPSAELSDMTFEHAADPLKPLIVSYQLRVPGFAERTGARLFFQPSALQKGVPPLFAAADRRSPILFDHLYREIDTVDIVLPPDFKLEAGNAPPPLDLGRFGRYQVGIAYTAGESRITCTREFDLFSPGVPPKFYAALKALFEEVSERDNHTLTFRTAAAAGGGKTE